MVGAARRAPGPAERSSMRLSHGCDERGAPRVVLWTAEQSDRLRGQM